MTANIEWLESAAGLGLLQEESQQVRAALESVFGDYLVQLGLWGNQVSFLQYARTRRKILLSSRSEDSPDALVSTDRLAVASDSIDAVLLPHVLETAPDPIAVLREVDRIMRPEGHIIILGFNPVSWWGLRHRLSRSGFPQGINRYIPERRLSDWLRLLNFRISYASHYYSIAPIVQSETLSSRDWRNWRVFKGGYILVACKELFTFTSIRSGRRRRTRLVGGLVNPTTRNAA